MTDQEHSAAREAVIDYRAGFGLSLGETGGPEKEAIEAMHTVLTKHEADVRKRIAYELDRAWPPTTPAYYGFSVMAIRDKIRAIVNPPKPPKSVLCEHCGRTEDTHALVMLNGERTWEELTADPEPET